MSDWSKFQLPRSAFRHRKLVVAAIGTAFAVPMFLVLLRDEYLRGQLDLRRGVILAGLCIVLGLIAGKLWSYLFLKFFVRHDD